MREEKMNVLSGGQPRRGEGGRRVNWGLGWMLRGQWPVPPN
jgi:hypothetical protein